MSKEKIKEFAQITYGLVGMVVFFAVLFYGGNKIIELIGSYYKYVFYIGLPIVVGYLFLSKLKK